MMAYLKVHDSHVNMKHFVHESPAQRADSLIDVGVIEDFHGAGMAKTGVFAGQDQHGLGGLEADDATLTLVRHRQFAPKGLQRGVIAGRPMDRG